MTCIINSTRAFIARMQDDVAQFCGAHGGNFMMTFGLLLVPIFGAVGVAVDYSKANNFRAQLQAAADAASLAAIARSSTGFNTAINMSSDGSVPVAETDAVKVFDAQISKKTGFKVSKVSASVNKTGQNLVATVDFSGTVPSSFLALFGHKSIPITGVSKAILKVPVFIDFYLLLDNSPSMGVAATPSDINTMVAKTPDQCAFACHDLSGASDYYTLAKSWGVTMRIDVLRTATQQLMDTATATAIVPGQFRAAIYTFNTDVQTITMLTSSLSSAKTQAANIDLMPVPNQGYNNDQFTDFNVVMPAVDKLISNPGDGSSSLTPQKVLFLVSDGLGDANVAGTRTIKPIDLALCTAIKNRGVKIAALYTIYLPLPTNAFYKANVSSVVDQIGPAMQSCASPGLYFEVSPTQGIGQAMQALFQKTIAQAHLAQ
jgi:Flp pilus assembly protein TadG